MNKNLLTTFLLAALVISALASIGLCYLCTRNAMRLVEIQQQVAFAQTRSAFISSLVKDVMDYSSKNPAINPILEAAGIQPPKPTAATSANKTGAK
jgi:hypothetical protein